MKMKKADQNSTVGVKEIVSEGKKRQKQKLKNPVKKAQSPVNATPKTHKDVEICGKSKRGSLIKKRKLELTKTMSEEAIDTTGRRDEQPPVKPKLLIKPKKPVKPKKPNRPRSAFSYYVESQLALQ